MTADEPFPYATRIVRVFPDYAGSVIWFSDPVPYEESRLSAGLVARLAAWEATYYSGLNDAFEWRSGEILRRFSCDGLELAREVSVEIGFEFEVEYRSFEDRNAVAQLRSGQPASNPDAHAAFAARAREAQEEWAALARRAAGRKGPGGGWSARCSSGAILLPPQNDD